MITKKLLREKSEECGISFSDLLSGCVCEKLVQIIAAGPYKKSIWLCNATDLSPKENSQQSQRNIYCIYGPITEAPLTETVFQELLGFITSAAQLEGMTVKGNVRTWGLKLEITIDDMYVPVQLFIDKNVDESLVPEEETMTPLMDKKAFTYPVYPKEQMLAKHLFEIITMLELTADMNHFDEAYKILTEYPVNGRKVKLALSAMCQDKDMEISSKRMEMIKGFESYTYMKKKWKVHLRQENKSEPEWTDLIKCLCAFLGPIWKSLETGEIFLGDWMPQLKRFLD